MDTAFPISYERIWVGSTTMSDTSISVKTLYDRFARELLGYARAILRHQDLAEDALQETFIRVAKHLDDLPEVSNVRAYLFRILRNEALRILDRERRRIEKHEGFASTLLIVPAPDSVDSTADIEHLNAALLTLPGDQREVIFLKCMEGHTFAEIAELLGIPANTAASR